jgi:hypothetical protein
MNSNQDIDIEHQLKELMNHEPNRICFVKYNISL